MTGIVVYGLFSYLCNPMEEFNKYLKGADLDLVKEVCIDKGRLAQYSRNEYFSRAGDVIAHVGYIKRGVFRYVCVNPSEEKEYSTGFAFEKEFVTDYPACIYQVPSEISIQAITSCEVYVCDVQEILQAFNENTNTQIQARKNAERILFCVYQNYIDLYRKTPEERYKEIIDKCPEILQMLTLKELASYLKITPVTMSKIRRKITFGY